MYPANGTVSLPSPNTVARRDDRTEITPGTFQIANLNMAQATLSSSFAGTQSIITAFQPTTVNVQPPAQNYALAHSLAASAQPPLLTGSILRTQHLVLPRTGALLEQIFTDTTAPTRRSDMPNITRTQRDVIENRINNAWSPIPTRRIRRTGRAAAVLTPEMQAKKDAEEQMVVTLENIAKATFPHFRLLQDNLLKHAMNLLGANMSGQALSEATVDAFATVLLRQAPHNSQQELKEYIRQVKLGELIGRVIGDTSDADPPVAAEPGTSTSAVLPTTTTPIKRKVPEHHDSPPQMAKLSRRKESIEQALKQKDGEIEEQWVHRLLDLGLPYRIIQKTTGYRSDTLRYTGRFATVPAEAMAIKNALLPENTFESSRAYALEFDKRSRHLNLSNQQKCRILDRTQRTLQDWGIIKILSNRALLAINRTDVSECITPLEEAMKYKRENRSLNSRDLIALTGVTQTELAQHPLFWKLSEEGVKAFQKEKRRREHGPNGEKPETEKEFAIRLFQTYNLDPTMPDLTLTDISLLSRVSLSTIRGLWQLKKPTDDTEALKILYPQEGRHPLDWALHIRHQDYSITLEQLSTIAQLDTWTISSDQDYLEWTPEAREAEKNVPRDGRDDYQYSLYLHLVRPDLSAAEISRVTGYRVTSMRTDKNDRGDFAALFGNKFAPKYTKAVVRRAKKRRAGSTSTVVSSVINTATASRRSTTIAVNRRLSAAHSHATSPTTPTAFVASPVTSRMEEWYEPSGFEQPSLVPVGDVVFPPPAMTNPPPLIPFAQPQPEALSPPPALATPDPRDIPMTSPQIIVHAPEPIQHLQMPSSALSSLPALVTPYPEDIRMTPPSIRASASRRDDWLNDLPSLPSDLTQLYVGADPMELPQLEPDMVIDETPWFPSENDVILLAEGTLRQPGGIHKQHVEWVLRMLVASVEFPNDVVLDITDRRYGVENNMKLRKPNTAPTANDKVISLVANQDMHIGNFTAPWWELNRQDRQNSHVPANSDSLFISISQGLAEYGLTTFLVETLHHMVADELACKPRVWLANMDMDLLRQHLETVRSNLSREKYIQLFGESP
ncbi:hypothetical protein L579_1265 [Pantoea sp. AS-PWVM4]|uniref:hypothetical protein n=1 Tax=Pantoea sp. AS-PWVM4 TaxID=1332069 RepID=UPI0003AC8E7E|nr:hypothetical protein [Pantoea sp. AS-PWVM4]ERK09482.1 hypothetical protein L579_1265 [Pantoea sp. AS-PWVM4]